MSPPELPVPAAKEGLTALSFLVLPHLAPLSQPLSSTSCLP